MIIMTDAQISLNTACTGLRAECASIERWVRELTMRVSDLPEGTEFGEVNANLMLSVRHLEDARMRLGKAIQWGSQGGVSKSDDGGQG